MGNGTFPFPIFPFLVYNKIKMFGLGNKRQLTLQKYECNPKIEGRLYVFFAVLTIIIFGGGMFLEDDFSLIPFLVFVIVTVALAAFGVYLLYFRKKPLKREVVLGTYFSDLYLRSKPLFIALETLYAVLIMGVLTLLPSLPGLFSDGTIDILQDLSRHGFITFGYVVYHFVQEYFSYYLYYKWLEDTAAETASGRSGSDIYSSKL